MGKVQDHNIGKHSNSGYSARFERNSQLEGKYRFAHRSVQTDQSTPILHPGLSEQVSTLNEIPDEDEDDNGAEDEGMYHNENISEMTEHDR